MRAPKRMVTEGTNPRYRETLSAGTGRAKRFLTSVGEVMATRRGTQALIENLAISRRFLYTRAYERQVEEHSLCRKPKSHHFRNDADQRATRWPSWRSACASS